MKTLVALLAVCLAALPGTVDADTFGTGENQIEIEFVDIGDAGNADDPRDGDSFHAGVQNFGAVPYPYRIGIHEISRGMINAANNEGGLELTMNDMSSLGGNGADRPAPVSWFEAARYVNWLNTSQGFQAAYQFTTQPGDPGYNPGEPLTLWPSAVAWQQGGENLFRHKDAHYFLPSEDEWYKAAYYDGETGVYYAYPTASDLAPTPVAGGTAAGTAVHGQPLDQGPADIMNAGGLSAYGTMAQGGNIHELTESGAYPPNDSNAETRVERGDDWFGSGSASGLRSSARTWSPPIEGGTVGFRVAGVQVPSRAILMVSFSYDPITGQAEVGVLGAPETEYKLIEADDLDFSNPDTDPIPLTGVTVGTQAGNTFTTDAGGNATVQFNLGTTKDATFIRAQTP